VSLIHISCLHPHLVDAPVGRLLEMGLDADANGLVDRLKLKLYRSLGIDAEVDKAGRFNKVIVRNTRRGFVDVVNIDPMVSRNFYTDRFWQTL